MKLVRKYLANSSPRARLVRRGGAIVETILVMPILVMLTLGAVEYTYFLFVKNALTGAARDGVRAAILSTATNTTVTSAITSSLTATNIPSSSYTVTLSPSNVASASAGSSVTVTITATWGTIGVLPLPVSMGGIPSSKQVTAAAVMMKEQ